MWSKSSGFYGLMVIFFRSNRVTEGLTCELGAVVRSPYANAY